MPYRIDIRDAGDRALDRLIECGALDIESSDKGGIAALMPDSAPPEQVARALGVDALQTSPAIGRDEDSVWVLRPRPFRAGRLEFAPAGSEAGPDAIRLVDTRVFGTGLHPTTSLCLDALDEAVSLAQPEAVLDVGTGSGVLALAALKLGVPRATAIDIDEEAVRVTAENARLNGLTERLQLARGGPETVAGAFPLTLANVLAAPLIEMAPVLVRRVGHHGRLVLSGIPAGMEPDVDRAYRRLGMQLVASHSRAGWAALVLQATW